MNVIHRWMREDYTWNIVVVHLEVCFSFTQIKLAILALYTRRVGNSLRKDGKKERERETMHGNTQGSKKNCQSSKFNKFICFLSY